MSNSHSLRWEHITDLPPNWKETLIDDQTAALATAWIEQAESLRQKSLFNDFLERLKRQWAIETGIIEGLYTMNEGATLILIQKGLDASYISHEDTDDHPQEVIEKIRDQYEAINGLFDFVTGERELGTSYIKELHRVLTSHQPTYKARDTLGQWVTRDLPRGVWKVVKNNVEHADGSTFEYCPPEHVDSEMDRLLSLHTKHINEGVPPYVEAAWLHHRFTLIHPFTDGNGRVARCLATLVLIKEYWFPLVITRDDRDVYIAALLAADSGDLAPLVSEFCRLQKKALREARDLGDEVVELANETQSVLDAVRQKIKARKNQQHMEVQKVFQVADSLIELTRLHIESTVDQIEEAIGNSGQVFFLHAYRNDPNSKYHYRQIVQCANQLGYFANFPAYQAWVDLVIQTEHRSEILFSFHGMGRHSIGVLACSAMFYRKVQSDTGENEIGDLVPLSSEPFEFTYLDKSDHVQKTFRTWLSERIVLGLKEWNKYF